MKPLTECALYTFVDAAYLRGRDPVELARDLCEGGSDLVQFRAKGWPRAQVRAIAEKLRPLVHSYNAGFVLNDHLEIALETGADFCHLGQEDFFDAGFKKIRDLPGIEKGKLPWIGLSTHAPAQAVRAVSAGADYVAIGPVFPTPTKPSAAPVTLEYVRWASANLSIPWFAIGGITLDNLEEVLAAGATRVCIVSAILNSDDVRSACRDFKTALRASRS
jgi:thiamine-phosphate pyrophosphorylase